jgi:hypothetical protein
VQSARVSDYWLGGKDNFPADRRLGDAIAEQVPMIRTMVHEQRAFLRRAVRFLAGEAGIRQFLDIGTGIPSPGILIGIMHHLRVSEQGGIANVPRSLADTEAFFAGLELVEPGLVPMAAWRPEPGSHLDPRSVYAYAGVARKP